MSEENSVSEIKDIFCLKEEKHVIVLKKCSTSTTFWKYRN